MVTYGEGHLALPQESVSKWINNAAHAVTLYFGHFPVKEVRLRVSPSENRSGVFHGTTWQRDFGAFTRISLGSETSQGQLDSDWMLTHEFVHTGFPNVAEDHHWIEEGLATYVEPVARAQAGQLAVERLWSEMVRDLSQGQPGPGDRGLDNTHTWARTYWGGALFFLVADVRIRERTGNRVGLQDALRAIVQAGGTIQTDWPIMQALAVGDRATGVPVLSDLYLEMKSTPVTVDLPALWVGLGVQSRGGRMAFDDDAPLAAVRKAITVHK